MEQIVSRQSHVKLHKQYLYLILLIVLTSFEYFFRAKNLTLGFYCYVFIDFLLSYNKGRGYVNIKNCIILASAISIVSIIQVIIIEGRTLNNLIGILLSCLGAISIGFFVRERFIQIFSRIIFFISAYSLLVYCLCLVPAIYDALFGFAKQFTSLNVEKAVMDGGGVNFIIYNFQTDFIHDYIGFHRNAGPFWEPGMFAFYINIALFFELFIHREQYMAIKILILILALISTFSTGGYIAGIALIFFFLLNKSRSIMTWLIFVPVAVISINYITQLEFVGSKFEGQYNNAEYGSDQTRFGAFITQLDMIENSPIIGGELLENYASTKTLASGTLLPFVEYGIPIGCLFFLYLYKACRNMCRLYGSKRAVAVYLYSFIILLSFSQTILLMGIMSTFLYSGLQKQIQKNVRNKLSI